MPYISLSVAAATTPIGSVMATVIAIADDPASPLAVSGVHRHQEEQEALMEAFCLGQTLIVFFDELSRPVARAHCVLEPSALSNALVLLKSHADWYTGSWTSTLVEVLDEVDAIVDPTRKTPYLRHFLTVATIGLSLSAFETTKISAIGDLETLSFQIEDRQEGQGLEQTAWHLLEHLFSRCIFHSPQVTDSKTSRELIDILSYSKTGLCLFECKAAAVLSTDIARTTERRAKGIEKQIDKGISQISGAMRSISSSLSLTSKGGTPIRLPYWTNPLHHGIVMVSELLPSADWESVAKQLLDASKNAQAMFHVLDLQELRLLVGVSTTPTDLVVNLLNRFKTMAQVGSAFIRARINGPPPP